MMAKPPGTKPAARSASLPADSSPWEDEVAAVAQRKSAEAHVRAARARAELERKAEADARAEQTKAEEETAAAKKKADEADLAKRRAQEALAAAHGIALPDGPPDGTNTNMPQ